MSDIKLSTGKGFYANGAILGLRYEGELDTLYGGYDGDVFEGQHPQEWHDEEDRARFFTPAERREIAEQMIKRWTEWSEQ